MARETEPEMAQATVHRKDSSSENELVFLSDSGLDRASDSMSGVVSA
jgi:hypothetical protein